MIRLVGLFKMEDGDETSSVMQGTKRARKALIKYKIESIRDYIYKSDSVSS